MGGTWSGDKVRAGLYMNFKAAALARITRGERGTTIIPLSLNWGDLSKVFTIEAESQVMEFLGYDINDPEMLLIREARKNAKVVKVWRLGTGGAKATGTVAPLTATAQKVGTRGNQIKIVIKADVVDPSKKIVTTLVNDVPMDEQVGVNVPDLQANAWVTWSGTGAIAVTAGLTLTGGTNPTVANSHYTDFLTACETQYYETIAYPTTDNTLKSSLVTFVKRMRDEEGKKIQGVLSDYPGDFEGIINVNSGIKLLDGTTLTKDQTVAWVAGATAGATITESLTYKAYDGAEDVIPRLTNTEFISAIKAGQFVFQLDEEGKVKVEADINSLTSLTKDKNQRFQKNRVIRVLDAINNDLQRQFASSYVGKIDNEDDGQNLLEEAIRMYMQTLSDAKAIKNYIPAEDVLIDRVKSQGDAVYATIGAQPVDSMEKFYFTVGVR